MRGMDVKEIARSAGQVVKNSWGLAFGDYEDTQKRMTAQHRRALDDEIAMYVKNGKLAPRARHVKRAKAKAMRRQAV